MSTRDESLRRRLQRLKGRAEQRRSPLRSGEPRPARGLPRGVEVETGTGTAFFIEQRFELEHRHGRHPIARLLEFEPALAAEVAGHPDLSQTPLDRLAFLDTETTGLAGGAGTLVFLVGIGRFEERAFVLQQYFLRDPQEESAMLTALSETISRTSGFVTFNGRSFDIPLLEMRYVMALRRRWALTTWPHLDLLHPSRRLWRRVLPDCRLGTIEQRVLQITRSDDDVPGEQIPGMYLDYLRTGDATDIERILYHNTVDVLSLVGLTSQILRRYQEADPAQLSGAEALAVARWHASAGRPGRARAAYDAATRQADDLEIQIDALRLMGVQAKREREFELARRAWEAWHALAPDDPRPCIEMAKFYEWQAKEIEPAQDWAQRALVALSHWPEDWRRDERWNKIEHRLRRLTRKAKRA